MSMALEAPPPGMAAPPTTLPEPVATPAAGTEEESQRYARWRGRISESKAVRKDYVPDWIENVDYRYGEPFEDDADEDRVAVNLDWSLTKHKQAQLFSQSPELVLHPKADAFRAAV